MASPNPLPEFSIDNPTNPTLSTRIICDELKDAITDYFKIGIELGIKHERLKAIELQYPSIDRRLFEVIYCWLECTDMTCTWRMLIAALKAIDRTTIAANVERRCISGAIEREYNEYNLGSGDTLGTDESSQLKSLASETKFNIEEMRGLESLDCLEKMDNSYPFLQVGKKRLSKTEQKELLYKLNDGTERIIDEFASEHLHKLTQQLRSSKVKSLREVLNTTKAYKRSQLREHYSEVFLQNQNAYGLFFHLGLSEYYPQKLCLQDALCIKPESLKLSLKEDYICEESQLPNLILHKLMAYDYTCRSDLMAKHHKKHRTMSMSSSNGDDGDNDDADDSEDEDNLVEPIHPVDGLLSLIICSDDFLRQDLYSRLAKCQLAVPFILPDPFTKELHLPIWAMRSIIKEWKCIAHGSKPVERVCPIINYSMPILSFIRFGRHQKRGTSKSKMLNHVISDSGSTHDHFFHRDCPGGQNKHLLGDGLVDMCWYLPAGSTNDVFQDVVTFLNLHGDAREHLEQMRYLSKISSMCFVLLTEKDLEIDKQTTEILDQFASTAGGLIVLNDVEKARQLKSQFSKGSIIKLYDKNADEVKNAIRKQIQKCLLQVNQLKTIEECSTRDVIGDSNIIVDEWNDSYQEGFAIANEIIQEISRQKDKTPNVKAKMLPLQGQELWQAWASKDKELYRQNHRD